MIIGIKYCGGCNAVCDDKENVKKLCVGTQASMSHLFFKDEVERFAAMTGDRNKMHMDKVFAQKQWFKKPIVHGMLAASLMSSVMGTLLPGHGTILMEDHITYVSPVYFGDTIQATVWFASCRETKKCYVGTFYGECRNQNGEITAHGTFKQMMMKNLFYVENPEEIIEKGYR